MRKLVFVVAILLLIFVLRPKGVWGEAKRSWEKRNSILRVLIVMITGYLIYGLYKMYQADMIPFIE